MSLDTEPDSNTSKTVPSAPNFLGKLWKAQVASGMANEAAVHDELPASVTTAKKTLSSSGSGHETGSLLPKSESAPAETASVLDTAEDSRRADSNGSPEAKSANSSQFLSKLWKAQKSTGVLPGSVSESSVPEAEYRGDGGQVDVDNQTSSPGFLLHEAAANSASFEIAEREPEAPSETPELFQPETTGVIEDFESTHTPSLGEMDSIKAPGTVAKGRGEVDAPAQRKAALAAYEKMKEEQRLKTERSKTVRVPIATDGELPDTTSNTEKETDVDAASLTRQSFNSTAKPTAQDIPQAPRALAAQKTFSKHPILIVLSVAAIAGAVAYFPTENANSNFHDGESKLASGDAKGAAEKLTKAIASKPQFEDAYLARARAYQKMGALDLAMADCKSAIGLHTGKAEAFEQRAEIELSLNYYRLAIDDINSVARIRGTLTPSLLWSLGHAYFGDGQYGKALIQFSKKLDREPQDVSSLVAKAKCYEAMNLPRQAIALCNSALNADKNSYDALILKARCEALCGAQTQAFADLNQAIAIQTDRPEAFIERGLLFAHQKDFTRALNDLNVAVKSPGGIPEARYQLAMVHALNSEKDKALEQFGFLEARQDFKIDNWFLINRSNTYAELKDFNHAIKDLQTALSNDRAYLTTCWLKLAECYESTKNYKQAAVYAGKVLVDEPTNSLALLKHSQYSRLSGNQMTAMSDLFKAIEADPNNPNAYAARGDLYAAGKQPNLADIDYRKASELAPLNVEFKKKLLACNIQTRRAKPQTEESSTELPALSTNAQSEIASANLATLKTKGYQALKAGHAEYAVAALTRAVYLDKNDANARRYLAYALLKINDSSGATSQFYAWENIANPDPSSEISFAKQMAMTTDASDVFEHLAERYRTNAPVLLEIARQCKFFNYTPIATSALDFGAKVATSDELVSFNRLRISLQQSPSSSGNTPASAPSAVPKGKPLKIEN